MFYIRFLNTLILMYFTQFRRTENLYEELLSRGWEEEQQPMERDKIGYGEIAFKSKSIKKTTFAMVATISSVIIFRYF